LLWTERDGATTEKGTKVRIRLTPATLARLEAPGKGRITIFDEHRDAPAGFCLRVSASGSKVYYLLTGVPGSAHRS
jgi:hypothetical protein